MGDSNLSLKVLFVCAENTCRSQMAEGFARHLGLDADSAGIKAGIAVNPAAIEVMAEVGIDVSAQSSKSITAPEISRRLSLPRLSSAGTWMTDSDSAYDAVVSLCSVDTAGFCPAGYSGIQLNWNIEDPWGQPLPAFRRIRDEIEEKVAQLSRTVEEPSSNS